MSVLITGGAGFIGNKVTEVMARNGAHVVSVDLVKPTSTNPNITHVNGDILNLTFVKKIFHEYDPDTIIHLVGLPSIGDCERKPLSSFKLNVQSVQIVLEGMRESNAKKIIFSSSATVYGYSQQKPITEDTHPNPTNIYGYHKYAAEQTIRAYQNSYDIKAVIFRLFNLYGGDPFRGKDVISIFIRRTLRGDPIIVKGGRKFRDFVHVYDVAKAFLATNAKNMGGTTINLGSGLKTTIMDVAYIIKTLFPNIEIKEESAPDDGMGLCADITLAKKLLGFKPKDSKKGIFEFVASYAQKRK
jgi:UDP-glucose 4-epimerase